MRILRNIIITLLLLALAAISVVGLMVELPPILGWTPTRINDLGQSFIEVMRPGFGLVWMWASLTGALLLVFIMTVFRRKKAMRIEVQMGGGRVVILDSAIKRYIRSALSELTDVTVKRIDLKDTRSGLSAEVHADVKTNDNLPVLERKMIQRVRAALAEDLGITSIADVHVFIRDFEVGSRGHADRHHKVSADPTPVPFQTPSAATGPFDQVPAPVPHATPSHGLPQLEEPSREETFFTPKPSGSAGPGAAVVALPANEAAAPVMTEPKESARIEPPPLEEPKPRKRGLFGRSSVSEAPEAVSPAAEAEPKNAADAPAKATYSPVTSAEGVLPGEVPPTELDSVSLSDEISKPLDTDAKKKDDEKQENRP